MRSLIQIVKNNFTWTRFGQALDNPAELLNLCECVLYIILFSAGLLYLLVYGGPPGAVQQSLAWTSYLLWCWMHVIGPGACLVSKALRRPSLAYSVILLQLGGNVITATGVVFFAISAFAMWGHGAYAGFLATIIFVAVCFLSLRDLRRLVKIEKRL